LLVEVSMHVISVSIVDPHPLYRRGLAELVRRHPGMRLIGDVSAGWSADELERSAPDVLVADPVLLKPRGYPLLRALAARRVATRVLLLASVAHDGDAYEALAAGACGFLSKGSEERDVIDAIHRVARGETVIARELQGDVATDIRMREATPRPVLSPREHQILSLSADGLTAPQMGARLHLSPATVKTHMLNLYGKLGVDERAAAVAQGIRRGLIE
jgi:two-component system nitrate/nitrite response regulator NarL